MSRQINRSSYLFLKHRLHEDGLTDWSEACREDWQAGSSGRIFAQQPGGTIVSFFKKTVFSLNAFNWLDNTHTKADLFDLKATL